MRSVKPYKMDQNNPLIHQVSINSHKVKPTHESWRSTNLSFGSHGIYKTKGLLHRGVSRYIKVCCISVPHTWIIPKQVCVKWIQYWEPVGLLWCHFTFISCSVHVSTNPGFAYLEKLPYRWTSEYFIYICFQFFHCPSGPLLFLLSYSSHNLFVHRFQNICYSYILTLCITDHSL